IDDILEIIADWNAKRDTSTQPELRIGVAMAAGTVVVGAVGTETRLEFTVIGDAVNMSAKLEKHTKAEKVPALTTLKAYRSAVQQGYKSKRPHHELQGRKVEGIADPLDLVILGLAEGEMPGASEGVSKDSSNAKIK